MIEVGIDEFCSNCMEWREYDEDGKCKVCGKLIKKTKKGEVNDGYEGYKSEGPSFEVDEESNENDDY